MNTKITTDNYHTLEPGDVIRNNSTGTNHEIKAIESYAASLSFKYTLDGISLPRAAGIYIITEDVGYFTGLSQSFNVALADLELLELETFTARRIREAQARMSAWIDLKVRIALSWEQVWDNAADMAECESRLGRLVWEGVRARFKPDPTGDIRILVTGYCEKLKFGERYDSFVPDLSKPVEVRRWDLGGGWI